MNNMSALDAYLDIDHLPDTWSEYSINYAGELLAKFSEEEWIHLQNVWSQKSEAWLLRLIDVLYSTESNNKYGILESIAMNSIDPVRFYAIEALELNTPAYMVTLQMAEYLRHLQQSEISSGLHERIISLLRYEQAQNPSGNV